MTEHNIVSRAQRFARKAHAPIIFRTWSGAERPHVVHIQEVADLVWASGGSDEEIAAAWLHDCVEDTGVTNDDIEREFGERIARIVHGLTDLDAYKNLPTRERKQKQAERIRSEDISVRRIKLADQTSNIRSVSSDPPAVFTTDECLHYIHGAKAIADGCRGLSLMLEKLFDEEYQKAVKRFSSVSNLKSKT